MKKLFLLLIILIPGQLISQYEAPMRGSTLFFGGVSYNPYDREPEYIQSIMGLNNSAEIKGNLALTLGYHTERNFDKQWGYGISIPLYYYIMNEDLLKTSPPPNASSENDKELGSQYIAGLGIGIELYYQFKFKGEILLGLESNYIIGNRYLESQDNIVYRKKNSFMVVPTFYAGIRFIAIELTWSYLKGITLKAGFPLNRSPL